MWISLVTRQAAALPGGAFQHVDDLAAVDVAQGRVEVLHCEAKSEHVKQQAVTSRLQAGAFTAAFLRTKRRSQ